MPISLHQRSGLSLLTFFNDYGQVNYSYTFVYVACRLYNIGVRIERWCDVKFWREGLESKGTKNEYMNYCDFSGGVQNE